MLTFITNVLNIFTFKESLGDELKRVALSGSLDAVKELLTRSGSLLSQREIAEAIMAVYSHLDPNNPLAMDIQIVIHLLEHTQDLEALNQIFEKPDCLFPLMDAFPAEIYSRLNGIASICVVDQIGKYLTRQAMSAIPDTDLIRRVLHFDNRLLMEWVIHSNDVQQVEHLIKIGVNHSMIHNGKTFLATAKEGFKTDVVKVFTIAGGEASRISLDEWRQLQAKEDEKLHNQMIAIAKAMPAWEITSKAEAALDPSGRILTSEQQTEVELQFSDSQKTKHPKDKFTPYSVVKSQEKDLFVIYNGKAAGLENSRIGKGTSAIVKYARNLSNNQWCAVKIQICSHDDEELENEVSSLKKTKNYYGRQEIVKGTKKKSYLFIRFVPGITLFSMLATDLSIRHQGRLMINTLRSVKKLLDLNIAHGDINLRNMMWDPNDWSVTLIDFGLSSSLKPQAGLSQVRESLSTLAAFITNSQLKEIEKLFLDDCDINVAIKKAISQIKNIINQSMEMPLESLIQSPTLIASAPLPRKSLRCMANNAHQTDPQPTLAKLAKGRGVRSKLR